MGELINRVAKRTGLAPGAAKIAITTVLDFRKRKLPAPVAGQIDTVLGGGSAKGVAGGIGGLFGKK